MSESEGPVYDVEKCDMFCAMWPEYAALREWVAFVERATLLSFFQRGGFCVSEGDGEGAVRWNYVFTNIKTAAQFWACYDLLILKMAKARNIAVRVLVESEIGGIDFTETGAFEHVSVEGAS